jgi:hypothetical protein
MIGVAGQTAVEGIKVDAVGMSNLGVHVQHGDLSAVRIDGRIPNKILFVLRDGEHHQTFKITDTL